MNSQPHLGVLLSALAAIALSACGAILAQESPATPPKQSPSATIQQAAWIAGHWRGEALGGVVEEIWSPPLGNNMMGMFRLMRNDKPTFFELMTISEENNSLILRIKHFHPNMVGWEEKDKSVEFALVSVEDGRAVFDGLTFAKTGHDQMRIVVQTKDGEGSALELQFDFQRPPKTGD